MKTTFFSIALVAFLSACDSKEPISPQPSNDVTVAYQKSVRLAGTALDMKVAEVLDSRCPINARCITAGSVRVNFEANNEGKTETVQVDLPAYPDKFTQKTFSVGGQSYQLTLREVLPYPEAGRPIRLEDYTVEFSVVKL
jgi:hypothetical protein